MNSTTCFSDKYRSQGDVKTEEYTQS